MTKQPTPQPGGDPASWYDDPEISNDDTLIRGIRSDKHIVRLPGGRYGVSDQLWSSQHGGCSVELKSLLKAANETAETRANATGDMGASSIEVGAVRATHNRIHPTTKAEYERLGVAYTPVDESEPFGPNKFHCDIFPILSPQAKGAIGKPGSRNLYQKAGLLFLDQKRAAQIWAERHGLASPGDDIKK